MTIVPRWEWRTFGDSFGPAEERFAALTPERVQESDETYVLSTRAGTKEVFQVAAEARAFLAGRGIEVSADQQTKTRKALEYFSTASKGDE